MALCTAEHKHEDLRKRRLINDHEFSVPALILVQKRREALGMRMDTTPPLLDCANNMAESAAMSFSCDIPGHQNELYNWLG